LMIQLTSRARLETVKLPLNCKSMKACIVPVALDVHFAIFFCQKSLDLTDCVLKSVINSSCDRLLRD